MAKSTIKLPNGAVIEISPDMSPDQITALVTAAGAPSMMNASSSSTNQPGKTIQPIRSAEDIWYSSKREKVALFIRNFFSENVWISAKDVVDQQITEMGSVELGESSQIGTYLARLFDGGYLDRQPRGRNVLYRINEKLISEYPAFSQSQFSLLLNSH